MFACWNHRGQAWVLLRSAYQLITKKLTKIAANYKKKRQHFDTRTRSRTLKLKKTWNYFQATQPACIRTFSNNRKSTYLWPIHVTSNGKLLWVSPSRHGVRGSADINHPVWKKSPASRAVWIWRCPSLPDKHVFKKNYGKLSWADHRSIFHGVPGCWCLAFCYHSLLASLQICKWTRRRLKSAEEGNLYVTVLLLSLMLYAGLMIIFHALSLNRPPRHSPWNVSF